MILCRLCWRCAAVPAKPRWRATKLTKGTAKAKTFIITASNCICWGPSSIKPYPFPWPCVGRKPRATICHPCVLRCCPRCQGRSLATRRTATRRPARSWRHRVRSFARRTRRRKGKPFTLLDIVACGRALSRPCGNPLSLFSIGSWCRPVFRTVPPYVQVKASRFTVMGS